MNEKKDAALCAASKFLSSLTDFNQSYLVLKFYSLVSYPRQL